MPGEGVMINDFGSITKMNWRALPLGRISVYFAVSSRVIAGDETAFNRCSHLIWVIPSKPGSTRRIG